MFANNKVRPNYSSPYAPSRLTNVTVEGYENIYRYDVAILWIAYGLSIFFALLGVIAGFIALWLNGASYSDSFSTVLRVSRTAELSVDVQRKDGMGSDPLPRYLENARLDLIGSATHSRESRVPLPLSQNPVEAQRLVTGPRNLQQKPAINAHRVTW